MKKLFPLLAGCLAMLFGSAQNISINNAGTPPDPSAMLDISSNAKGLLIPRMRSNERTSIPNPANGLIVFDVDTRSLWFCYSGGWKEMANNTDGTLPMGPALGDLSGFYPSPSVSKIQNLDVAFGVPSDRQALKWDMLNNRWQGANDSLFLPYNVQSGNPAKLFGITNANTTNGAVAIYGRSGISGSGISPAMTMGVWGDNSTGAGVLGTSSNGVGTYGYSVNNHGSYGFTGGTGYAGVYGSRVNNGPAVMGDIYSAGTALYGKSNGTIGKAGVFENLHASNTDTVVKFVQKGTGSNGYFISESASNGSPLLQGDHYGTGSGLRLRMFNSQSDSAGVAMYQYGNGDGIYIQSAKSKAARFHSTAANTDTAVFVLHDGLGPALQVQLSNASNNREALRVRTLGTNQAAKFSVENSSNGAAAVEVTTNGSGRALQAVVTNSQSNAAALYASSSGANGIQGYSQGTAVLGQATGLTGGIGVLGQSSLNSADGIGVKAVSYSTGYNSGALTAINNADGLAVYASSALGSAIYATGNDQLGGAITGLNTANNGYGVYGYSTGTDGAGIYGDAGQGASLSKAAIFRNVNASNYKTVVDITNSGTGDLLYMAGGNSANTNPMLQMRNSGSGKFLLLEDETANEKFSVTKSGNIATDGTLTVKAGKGIVRNSTSTQVQTVLMTVAVAAGSISHFDPGGFNGGVTVPVTFTSAFSATPHVYIGNVSSGNLLGITVTAENVTTTGCNLLLRNWTAGDLGYPASTIKIMAIGAE